MVSKQTNKEERKQATKRVRARAFVCAYISVAVTILMLIEALLCVQRINGLGVNCKILSQNVENAVEIINLLKRAFVRRYITN